MNDLNMTKVELARLIENQNIVATGDLKKTHINDVMNIIKAFKNSDQFLFIFEKIFDEKFAQQKWNLSTLKSYRRSISRMKEFLETSTSTAKEKTDEKIQKKATLTDDSKAVPFDIEPILDHFEKMAVVVEYFKDTKKSGVFDDSQLVPIIQVCLSQLSNEITSIGKLIKTS